MKKGRRFGIQGFCFNTASGMDCMQYPNMPLRKWKKFVFQYRKRYGLHAIRLFDEEPISRGVSIPQAVWIACNTPRSMLWPPFLGFQYRKRYGLHAIPSLTALGTAEPRSGFSKRSALFGKSPQPRGIFLSPKSAENVRKPCNIKETFVHGKNLKLMAFSPKSFPSL